MQHNKRPAPGKLSQTNDASVSSSSSSCSSEGGDGSPPVVEYNSVGGGGDFRGAVQPAEQLPSRPRPTVNPAAAAPSSAMIASTGSTARGSTGHTGTSGTSTKGQHNVIAGGVAAAEEHAGEQAKQEGETYAVVFMTQSLGITLAASEDGSDSLVVCDKERTETTTTTTSKVNPCSRIGIGDHLIGVGGTSAIGLGVNRVERLTVRGSRPLEMVFRRRRPSSRAGAASDTSAVSPTMPAAAGTTTTASPSTGTASTSRKQKQRPPGGLEQPSRDCLLDIISGIATQEDSLLAESQSRSQWPHHQHDTDEGLRPSSMVADDGRSTNDNAGGVSPAASGRRIRSPPSSFTPPRRPIAAAAAAGAAAVDVAAITPREHCNTAVADCRHQSRRAAPPTSEASPSSSSSSSSTEADVASPDVGGTTIRPDVRTPALEAELTVRVCESQAPVAASATKAPTNTTAAFDQNSALPRGETCAAYPVGSDARDGVVNSQDPNPGPRPKSNTKKKVSKVTAAAGAPLERRDGTGPVSDHATPGKNFGRAGQSSPLSSAAPGGSGDGTGTGTGKRPVSRVGSAVATAEAPTPAEVTRILAKLGPKGVSELALYKNLTFDELVRVCRYTARVDLSKRLPKATMAERLNSLCTQQGALASELRAAGAEGGEKRAGRGGGGGAQGRRGGEVVEGRGRGSGQAGVGIESGSAQGAATSDGGVLRTPLRSLTAAAVPVRLRGHAPIADALPQAPTSARSTAPLSSPYGGDRRADGSRPTSPSSCCFHEAGRDTLPPEYARAARPPPPPSPPMALRANTSIGHGPPFAPPFSQPQEQQGGTTPSTPRQLVIREHDDKDDDKQCWADWEFPDKSTRVGGGGGVLLGGRGRGTQGEASTSGGGHAFGSKNSGNNGNNGNTNDEHHDDGGRDGGTDDEAAWWSREPDYRDWSPCSSPTAAALTSSRAVPAWTSTPASLQSPFGEGNVGNGVPGGVGSGFHRRNPLLPPGASSSAAAVDGASASTAASSEPQRQQMGRNPLSLLSGRFPGGGLGFTVLPKWILRSVRTIGTQVNYTRSVRR